MPKKTIKESGFTILETMIALIVMIAVLTTGATWIKLNADNNLNRSAAENLTQLTKAVQWYARDNLTTLINAGETEVDFDTLIKGKYLNKGFSQKNSYGQTYKITISENNEGGEDNNSLQLLITTQGGDIIKVANMRKIAALAGSEAGYSEQSGKITGNQEGWFFETAINPGHLATLSYVFSKDIVSAETFLRRDKFDGHPEWNQMNTDLDMQSNAVVAENDNSKSSFSADMLSFDNGELTAKLSADEGLSLKNGDAEAALNTDGVSVKSSSQSASLAAGSVDFTAGNPVSGLSSFVPSSVSASSVKPAFIEVEGTKTVDVWKAADDVCKDDSVNNIGRLIVVSRKGDPTKGLFICGPKDGKEIGSGRAYLINSVGNEETDDRPSSSKKIYVLDHAKPGCGYGKNSGQGCISSFNKYLDAGNIVTNFCKQKGGDSGSPWIKSGKSDPQCELEECRVSSDSGGMLVYENGNNCTIKMD